MTQRGARDDRGGTTDGLAGIQARLAELGLPVASATRIGVENNNNRLFRLELLDRPALVAKIYYRDGRRRLEREHDALSFLAARSFPSVPRPIARDDEGYWAAYTFEPGSTKRPRDLTAEDIRSLARFAADLHRIPPSDDLELGGLMRLAAPAGGDLRHYVETELDRRLALAPPEVARGVVPVVKLARERAVGSTPLPRGQLRLNQGDFAPHNVHFDASRFAVLDWESAGWDDPAGLVLDFLLHEATRGLPRELENLFLETYFAVHPEQDFERWRHLYEITQLIWTFGFLNAFDPEYVERKRFANPELDVAAFQAGQIAKLRARLERVVDSPPDPLKA